MSILSQIKADGYRIGNCQAIMYDARRTDIFETGFLGRFYKLCLESGRRTPTSLLDTVFAGNPPSTFDAIVSYLASHPLVILGVWEGETFKPQGGAFLQIFCGVQPPERAAFCGYLFLRDIWGTEELDALGMLGLALLFEQFDLKAIHGIRYSSNLLTKKFTEKFGFRQVGEIPFYQLKDGKLAPGIVTTLLRSDFEKYVAQSAEAKFRTEAIGTEQHPVVEEAQSTVDAQMERLVNGDIPIVFFPAGSQYIPFMPDGIEVVLAENCPGAGIYFYREDRISRDEILQHAAAGTHGKLLGHTQEKREIVAGPTVIVQAVDERGRVVKDSLVRATAEAIAAQVEEFAKSFPDCKWRVKRPDAVIQERIESRPPEKTGQKGGKARAKKLDPARRREIAQKAARARWKK